MFLKNVEHPLTATVTTASKKTITSSPGQRAWREEKSEPMHRSSHAVANYLTVTGEVSRGYVFTDVSEGDHELARCSTPKEYRTWQTSESKTQ